MELLLLLLGCCRSSWNNISTSAYSGDSDREYHDDDAVDKSDDDEYDDDAIDNSDDDKYDDDNAIDNSDDDEYDDDDAIDNSDDDEYDDDDDAIVVMMVGYDYSN